MYNEWIKLKRSYVPWLLGVVALFAAYELFSVGEVSHRLNLAVLQADHSALLFRLYMQIWIMMPLLYCGFYCACGFVARRI